MLRANPNSPSIDHLFALATAATPPRWHQAERHQIELIRTLGRDIFGEEEEEEQQPVSVEREGRGERERGERERGERVRVHERGLAEKKRKMERIMLNKTAVTARTEKMQAQTSRQPTTNRTAHPVDSKYKNNPRKEERFVKEVVKKRIDEEQAKMAENIGNTQREKANHAKTARKNETQNQKTSNPQGRQKHFGFAYAQLNRKATKEEVDFAFEEVVRKSEDILRRKQRKIEEAREEMFGREMEGVTFVPHLASCERLRKCDTRSFLQRLDSDHISRDVQKTTILREQLSRDPFKPRLNDHANTHSASKISSFRHPHLIATISSTHLLHQQLSRLTHSHQALQLSPASPRVDAVAVVEQRDLDFLLA